jgi:hypothetical protein
MTIACATRRSAAALLAACSVATPTLAALVDRGNGLLYEDVLNITILQDANFAKTSGFDSDGRMTWETANSWVQSLTIANTGGWRLPTTQPLNGSSYSTTFSTSGSTDYGYNVSAPGSLSAGATSSEMAYLFFNSLGNIAEFNLDGSPSACRNVQIGTAHCLSNTGLFDNLESYTYWSGSASPEAGSYWTFTMDGGFQPFSPGGSSLYALLVHDGDIASLVNGSLPEAPSLILSFTALALLLARANRKSRDFRPI